MTTLLDLLQQAFTLNASDLHLTVGAPPTFRINGTLVPSSGDTLSAQDTHAFAQQIMSADQWEQYHCQGELDFSYLVPELGRFRVNVFLQRGSHALALRTVALCPPRLQELGLPPAVRDLALKTGGLILVTGPAGSGKSTTLAAMINEINHTRSCHIITLEDPIEFLHRHERSIINQREIGRDTKTYASGLRAALREDPDVILIGEMRDPETISIAVTAAETGHLVLSTLHTKGAAQSIDRIVDAFPPYQQNQIRLQLSNVLEGVISQQLLRRLDVPGRVLAMELLGATPAVRNLIREGKTHQIDSLIQIGAQHGMISMDQSLVKLYRQGRVAYEEAVKYVSDPKSLSNHV